ncbi:AcrR family transcriptional regulator [Brevibacterium pityocampae]
MPREASPAESQAPPRTPVTSEAKGVRVRKRPEERRAEIADAAAELALADGLDAVTLRSVAQRLAVTPALVAHYVESMDELRADTVTRLIDAELTAMRAAAETEPTVLDGLRALLGALFRTPRAASAAVWLGAWTQGLRVPVVAAAVRAQMDDWQEFVTALLARGCAAGEFDTADSDAVAWQLIALADGLNAHSLVSYRDPAAREALLAGVLERSLDLPAGTLAPGADPAEPKPADASTADRNPTAAPNSADPKPADHPRSSL